MPDTFSPSERHSIMAAIHSASTKPEILLRHALWSLGFRYKNNDRHLPGTPDIVLPKYRTVIFVHGCFWHGHSNCKKHSIPKTNTDFWVAKIARNKERDQEVWRQLEAKGWYVIIVWECQLKKTVLQETCQRIEAEVFRNGEQYQKEKEQRKASRLAYQQQRKTSKEKEKKLLEEIKGGPNESKLLP